MATRPLPAYNGNEPYVFVSYSHDDSTLAYPVIRWLQDQGFNVWYDQGINPGAIWRNEIADAISGASAFLFLLTSRSAASEHCQRELSFGQEEGKPILPVHLEPTELPSRLRFNIGDRQAILAHELSREAFETQLRDWLAKILPHTTNTERISPASPDTTSFSKQMRITLSLSTLALLVIAGVIYVVQNSHQEQYAIEQQQLEEVRLLISEDRYGDAFLKLQQLRSSLDGNPMFSMLWDQTVRPMSPRISEDDAVVYFRPYSSASDAWVRAGKTPLTDVAAPIGVLVLRVEKPGYETGTFVVANPGAVLDNETLRFFEGDLPKLTLIPKSTVPNGMEYVPASDVPAVLGGAVADEPPYGIRRKPLAHFAIGRAEVTNREFKAFVDGNGYGTQTLWEGLSLADETPLDGNTISTFVDTTGRPGPAVWELGSFPPGTADHPVGGISWYEAVAYARFSGAELPTVHHWLRAAQGPLEGQYSTAVAIAPRGNFNSRGPRPADPMALGPWGTFDTAGNVREWVWNAAGSGRLSMGGGWTDYPGSYLLAYSVNPTDRAPQNGLRLMRSLEPPENEYSTREPIELSFDRPGAMREPISDQGFEVIRDQFIDASETPESVERKTLNDIALSEGLIVEEIQLTYSTGDLLTLYIGRPEQPSGKLQSVVFVPTGGAFALAPNREAPWHLATLEFIMRTGRAVVLPIWKGSFERADSPALTKGARDKASRERALGWYEDLSRTIDYFEIDDTYDSDRLALFGFSYGGMYSPILMSTEPRLKTGIVVSAGSTPTPEQAMWDPVNYLPRVTLPLLYITGEFDPIFPRATSQARFLDLLGTPDENVRHVLFNELGHFGFPRNRFYREVGDWLDRHLGRVQRSRSSGVGMTQR